MKEIINVIEINENIMTSGQPTKDEFEKIANAGYEVIINLAVCHSEGKLEDEDIIVTNLGMNYFHIPVEFTDPKQEELFMFIDLLKACKNRKVWVHCILNYRVTAFMYVYNKFILKTPFDEIDLSLLDKWKPDFKWQEIIKIQL